MKNKVAALLLVATMITSTFTMTGCGKETKSYANGELNVGNWGEYIDPDVIDEFEEKYQIKVNYQVFSDNEIMYSKIDSGTANLDVVCPSDYMIQKLISKDLIQPLDYSQIPNSKYIDPMYYESSEVFDPGNLYSIPYCWGTVGILYNKTMVDEPITSWSAIRSKIQR